MTFCRGQLLAPENFFSTGVYFCDVNSFWFMTPVEAEAAAAAEEDAVEVAAAAEDDGVA